MISSLLLATNTGQVLLRRDYKNVHIRPSDLQTWATQLQDNDFSPIHRASHGLHFITLKSRTPSNLLLTALTTQNANVLFILEFLSHLRSLFQRFLGNLTVDSVKSNCTTLLSILEETVDYGVPQLTDGEALRPLLLIDDPSKNLALTQEELRRVTDQWTGICTWRRRGLKYKRNEVYIDVVEDLNAVVSPTGEIILLEVMGHVAVRAMLTGMPDCKFGINDRPNPNKPTPPVLMDDVQYHQCIRKVDPQDKAISFIPPDGSFQLMSYRMTKDLTLPFVLTPDIKQNGNRIQVVIRLKTQFPRSLSAICVKANIPTPDLTARVTMGSCTSGKAVFVPEKQCVEWSWKRLAGGSEGSLSYDVDLAPSGAPVDNGDDGWVGRGKGPISMSFDLPTHAASGLKVRFMKVQDSSGYKTVKWIRYLTRGGAYHQRI